MMAFEGAIKTGAQALETDIHLSKDGVAVLSHDSDLKRCYGVEGKVIDYDWKDLQTLRTIKEPHVPMPRLSELVELLVRPENKRIWLMLDIKLDNVADDVMFAIAREIARGSDSTGAVAEDWHGRIQLGCWSIEFTPFCEKHLPGFPITFIGFSLAAANRFLEVPEANFNLVFPSIIGPFGSDFVRRAQSMGREVYVWTVNETPLMKWAISLGVDGIVTDESERLLGITNGTSQEAISLFRWVISAIVHVWWPMLIIPFYAALFKPKVRVSR
ncbi:hypothetical protein DRE_04109 [Drechslerella stenobrocha 248]|uniref:GP-PDE domain-containing protein n=1 Tax=Drechslerella stenobrocha 248 TaxID=1043628 RepID=W7I2K2_9PEZI|nr:hypothetical protein DRE_04109 [Drechslerella stenobrocha 248]